MSRGIIQYLIGAMIVCPLTILFFGGRVELAISVAVGFVFWIFIVYIIAKPIEVVVKNKNNIKKVINKNQKTPKITIPQNNNIINTNKEDSLEKMNITSKEEEEIYAKVSKEFSENKKEGLWTKALIQSDGDESKAKITYIKLRVSQLINELAKFKLANQELELKQKEEELMKKQLKTDINSVIEQLEKLVNNSKANKIKGRELIPTEYIELIQKLYNPKIHQNVDDYTINQQLKKLIKNSKSNKIKGYEVIPSEYITKIISKFKNKK